MKATSLILTLVIGVVLGIFIGPKFFSNPQVEAPAVEMPLADCGDSSFNASLKNITPEEIRAYLNSQSIDEKLKRSDEILGKIMQAMVAHLGFKLGTEDLNKFGQTSNLALYPAVDVPTSSTLAVSRSDISASPTTLPSSGNFSEASYLAQVKRAVSDEDIKKVIDQLPPNPLERIQSANPLSPGQVRVLRGRFEGRIIFIKDGIVHRTTVEFEDTPSSGKSLQGRAKVVIYNEKGRAYSTSRGEGDLSGKFSGSNYSMFFELGGDYMELIYFPERDFLSGNFYETKNAKLSKVGTVTYNRL